MLGFALDQHGRPAAAEGQSEDGPARPVPASADMGQQARVAGGPPLSSGSRSDLRRPKLLFARAEGGEAEPLDTYKLHRPAATYTTHPQWQYLSGGDCSLEEACKLLADHGVAAEFLKPPPAAGGQSQGRGQPMPRQGQQGQQGQQQQQQQQQQHLHQHQQQQQQQQPGAGGGTPGQSGRGVEGRLGGSSGGGGGGGLPVAGAGRTSDRWQGLFPEDTGCYSVRLSPSLASGKGSDTTIPAAYVEAIAGTEQAPLMLTVTTPDGMQHSWHVRFYERQGLYYLCRVGATAATLGASAGDRLCIQPTDPAEAKVWLEREAAGAGVHPDAQQQQQPEQQAAASGSSGKRSRDTEDAWQPGSGNEGGSEGSYEGLSSSSGGSLEAERLLAGRLLSGGSRRPQKGRGSRVASTDKWSGLEEGEEDEGVYTLTLPAAAFKEGGSLKIHTPARYLKALFGEAPKVGQPATPITITALSRSFTCGMALYSRRKGCVLLGVELGSLLASLGAQLGDELQLQPAGKRTARVTLVKVAANVAAAAQPEELGAAAAAAAAPVAAPHGQGPPPAPPPPLQQQRQQAAASNSSDKRSRDTEDAWQPGGANGGSEESTQVPSSDSGGSLEAGQLSAGRLPGDGPNRPQQGQGCPMGSTGESEPPRKRQWQQQPTRAARAEGGCSNCGSLTPGPPGTKGYNWRRHPATGSRLCGPCGQYADNHDGALRRLPDQVQQQQQSGSENAAAPVQQGLSLPPPQQGSSRPLPGNAAVPGEQQASRRSGGLPTNWRGLESEGTGRYSLVLSPIVVHREHRAGIPERYAVAVFGQSPAQLNQQKLAVTATTPADGRGGKLQLGGLTSLLSSLSAAAGDRLCFKPVGKLAATATLIPAAAAAAAGGGGVAGPEWQAAEPQLPQQQVGSTALPSTAAEPGQQKRGFSHSNWSALGPEVTDRYAVVLPSHAVSDCRVWVPDRYATAVFGHSPHQLNQDKLAVTVTAADETHSLTLSARHGSACQLSGMRSLLASLGAAAGDQLCFQPAGPLAAEVTLIKAAAAAAGGGTGEPAQQQLDEDGIEEMEYEEEAVEADWEQAEDAQGESLQPQHSPAADGGQSGAAGGWSGPPSQAAQQQHPTSAVSAEMSALLKTAEEHGCLPAGALATYQAKFDAHPSLDWQLMCRTTLRALVQERNWGAVGAWIQTVLPP